MKFVSSVLATAAFILLLLATYCLHVRFFKVDVILYSALLDALIATLIAAVFLFWPRKSPTLGVFEKILLVVTWLLGGYAFAISVPTVLDRSLSFYILEKLDQRGGAILANRFADVFTDEYMHEMRLVDVRLTEQEESGTVRIENGCVMLTDRGREIASFSRFFRNNLLPPNRLLRGEYTGDLTNPFKNSIPSPDYACNGTLQD
ncbi:hypothetical protein FMN50_00525 [Rhodobacterales bacterium]|nr:hypothetical protein FMN50_00525 [Rhodobacterales bacterium]